MTFRPGDKRPGQPSAATTWRELALLVSECKYRGDAAFTTAVNFIQDRPQETISALRSELDRVSPQTKETVYWILAYAAAREGHSDAVADSLDDYLRWKPRRDRMHLKRSPGFKEAVDALRAAIAIGDLASLWNDLGVLHFSFGYIEEASRLFSESLARDPTHRYATINYAVALLAQGNRMESQDFVARTDFGFELPIHLVRIVAAVRASATEQVVPKPKDCWYWYRRCIYSYGWRSYLPQLFEGHVPLQLDSQTV